jgi:two-component system sensor histidine kinase HydH
MHAFFNKVQFLKARHLLLLFIVLATLMISSALIELRQSKRELIDLMTEQAHILAETILMSSRNTLKTNFTMEELIEERLLNNATVIKSYYEMGLINNGFLQEYAQRNNLYRINIFNSVGLKIYSNQQRLHDYPESDEAPSGVLDPIFKGIEDTLLLGLKVARHEEGFRYALAISTKDRSAIVVNLDAAELLRFRKEIGFGSLLQRMVINPGILYAALQDTAGILAASGNIVELERINASKFLTEAVSDSALHVRESVFNSQQVFEAVHAFYFESEPIGLLRIGLSLEPLNAINHRIYQRIIIISIILIIVGFILLTLLMVRQNLEITSKQYQTVETYSQNIIQNVSDVILVYDTSGKIKIFNHSAEKLFSLNAETVVGNRLIDIFGRDLVEVLKESDFSMQEKVIQFADIPKSLLLSQSRYVDENSEETVILVIRDLTEQKRLEAQIQRRERLSALGELASGVAHEIRNPLNAISTAVQQLDRDFKPQYQKSAYHQLTRMVYQEVKRMNQTIEDFLKFARPSPVRIEEFSIQEFMSDLRDQYQPLCREKNIDFQLEMNWNGKVRWDKQKMKQVFLNLVQNAIDAFEMEGKIRIQLKQIKSGEIEISLGDNGSGIPAEVQKKIFNLYFTTKAKGTGIGLSIVQRIVDQHGGVISFESETGKGTVFLIKLPVSAGEDPRN